MTLVFRWLKQFLDGLGREMEYIERISFAEIYGLKLA